MTLFNSLFTRCPYCNCESCVCPVNTRETTFTFEQLKIKSKIWITRVKGLIDTLTVKEIKKKLGVGAKIENKYSEFRGKVASRIKLLLVKKGYPKEKLL